MSISEAYLERAQSPIVNGHGWGVEDLFSNWVDTPSLSSGWIARNIEFERNGADSAVYSHLDLAPLVPADQPKLAIGPEPSANSDSQPMPAQAPADIVKTMPETAEPSRSDVAIAAGFASDEDCHSSATASDRLSRSPSMGCGR